MPPTLKKSSPKKTSLSGGISVAKADLREAKKFFVGYFKTKNGEEPEAKVRNVVQAYREAAHTRRSAEAEALLRGIEAQNQLKNAEGGSLSADEVRPLLGLSKQGVLDRHKAGALLGWREKQNAVRFPAWQFTPRGVLPGMAESLRALHEKPNLDDWAKVLFYLSPRESLGGRRPLDLLKAGQGEKVRSLAEGYGR